MEPPADDAADAQLDASIDAARGAEIAARIRGAATVEVRDGADAALAALGGALDAKLSLTLSDAGLERWRGGLALDDVVFEDASSPLDNNPARRRWRHAFRKRADPSRLTPADAALPALDDAPDVIAWLNDAPGMVKLAAAGSPCGRVDARAWCGHLDGVLHWPLFPGARAGI